MALVKIENSQGKKSGMFLFRTKKFNKVVKQFQNQNVEEKRFWSTLCYFQSILQKEKKAEW